MARGGGGSSSVFGRRGADQRPMRQSRHRAASLAVLMAVWLILIRCRLGRRISLSGSWLVRFGRRSGRSGVADFKSRVAGRAVRPRFDVTRTPPERSRLRVARFSVSSGHLSLFVFMFGIAGSATRLPNGFTDHRDNHVLRDASFTRTVVINDVAKPQRALLHSTNSDGSRRPIQVPRVPFVPGVLTSSMGASGAFVPRS